MKDFYSRVEGEDTQRHLEVSRAERGSSGLYMVSRLDMTRREMGAQRETRRGGGRDGGEEGKGKGEGGRERWKRRRKRERVRGGT